MAVTDEISKVFNKQAPEYEAAARVQREIGSRLLERLQYLKITPQRILNLGCGPASFSPELSLLYPKAHIVNLDLAQEMLVQAKKKYSWWRKGSLVTADMHKMPFAADAFDLVFANQVIHWANPIADIFRELNRVMSLNACLMFTTLGPETFKEINYAWSQVHSYLHVNQFIDMHDIGDLLMSEFFLDPVMDMEMLSMHYRDLSSLITSLKKQGVRNINAQRNQGLTGRQSWSQFEQHYATLKTENGKYPLSYEVVYGHAWKGARRKTEQGSETYIPISAIVKR